MTAAPATLEASVDDAPVRHTWSESDRFVPRAMVRPLQRFMAHEAASGVVMLAAAAVALIWANSPWGDSYARVWETHLVVELGDLIHLDHLNLQAWVNDALMTLFFLLVGVEVKREVVHGSLRDLKSVTLPILAALGGMVVPAGIYALVVHGQPGGSGWGIPMATDIAFAVGVVTLAGSRVPAAAKVFLLTLAVADDIGAILVIAVFYTDQLSFGWLATGAAGLLAVWLLRRSDVQALAPYLAIGAFCWFAILESGIHATLVGVVLGLLTPAWPLRSPQRFPVAAQRLSSKVDRAYDDDVLTEPELEEVEHHIAEVQRLAIHTTSPLGRLERGLAPWVAFVIVPVFALANAGVELSGGSLSGIVNDPVSLGVVLGLLVGKPVGVITATVLGVRAGWGRLPAGTSWGHVVGLGMCAGVGFTVALFVTSLSFDDHALTDAAKVGILAGSLVAGVLGYLLLRRAPTASTSD